LHRAEKGAQPEQSNVNKDQVKGAVKNVAGKIQEQAGKMVGSKKQQVKGRSKQVSGKIQKSFGDAKQSVEDFNES
jgi:uncharacterized protein YjbJ (UPF0337 family)